MILLDSNVVIYAGKRNADILAWIDEQLTNREQFLISSVSLVEVLGFQTLPDREASDLENLLETMLVVPVTERIAKTGVDVRRASGLKTVDSIIAATALEYHLALASRDRDFRSVPGLTLIEV